MPGQALEVEGLFIDDEVERPRPQQPVAPTPALIKFYTSTHEPEAFNAIADFVLGIESGQPTQPDFRNALQTQRVCDAVLQSAADRQWKNV